MERIVLRPHDERRMPVVTFRYPQGYVTPVVYHRTKKWHATEDVPLVGAGSGGLQLLASQLGPAFRTKREALASLTTK
jgi:hypothetical protein